MQPPLVIKQGTNTGQVGMQPGIVTVNSSMPASIPNVMTLDKPGGQNVVVTTQNLGSAQPTIIPNVQILNMRPGAPTVAAQKSVATVSPRVVIGTPQVVGTRATAPITLQTLQSLQQGQQGHLLLKTENGQYQLLRVGPAPTASTLTAPQTQTIRLSTVPAHPGVATVSTSVAAPGPLTGQMPAPPIVAPIVASAPSGLVATPPPQQQQSSTTHIKPSDNTKEKCRNFLANLLDLSSKEPPSVERNVRNLIQELIDAQVEPEEFCDRLERLLNASPQPCLIGFLKKSLPLLRHSLVTKELVIEGINPPAPQIAFSAMQATSSQPFISSSNIPQKPAQKSGSTISVLQNIPLHTKINVNKVGKSMTVNSKANFPRSSGPSTALSTVLTPGKSLLKDKEKKSLGQFSQPFVDDKMAGDDDINDVAAMGGVNLAEESQRILGSTEMIGTQIRSCREEYLVPTSVMQARIKTITSKHNMEESPPEVANIISHAVQERLKTLVEKLANIAQHRIDLIIKTDNRYEITQDVKGQLKFLEELDRVDKKRREDSEREMLLRAAKSRSKNEDPEQAKLKAKAKEMQRAELEDLRQREANLTALQAIGPRKKARLDMPAGSGDSLSNGAGPSTSSGVTGRSQMALRTRLKRINLRDMIYLMEQERDTCRSTMLYKCYLKVGWSIYDEPNLIFKNLIARPRKDRCKKDAEPPATPPIQIGNDIVNIEAVRFQLKTQFDKNVVTHFEAQEQVFDYIFSHLGIDNDGSVPHPIAMTEAFVTPNYCRQLMSELLFEGYGIPGVSYGVDSLFSMYKNDIGDTALIVNCGYHTIHLIPVVRGQVIVDHARRINLGGSEMIYYLHKLLQLKYPVHVNAITMSRVEEILQEHSSIALDYQEEIRKWANADYYEANVKRVQLPYVQAASSSGLTAEQQKERKKEMARRLLEINARKREERLAEDEEQLNQLLSIKDMIEDGDTDEFNEAIKGFDIKSYEDLQRQITNVNMRIEKNKQRIAVAATAEENLESRPTGRMNPPLEPDAFQVWLNETRTKYRELVGRREARRARRAAMVKRRTAAAAERMRVISRLAAAGDDFGNQDSDWDAYKSISREADSDSEADGERLLELEEALREYEPPPANSSQHHQLHLAIEPLRAPELMFQPSMMGNLEAGLAETLEYVFKHFSPEDQLLLANNVFLTGGSSQFPGLKERLERELLEMRPFQSSHKVVMAKNPSLDAWYGARDFAGSNEFENLCISKEEYYEMGAEYLKEHYASNKYYKSPAPIVDNTLAPAIDANVVKEEIVVDC